MEITYLYRSKHFGGMILFHDMDGNFVNGWEYKKGEIVGTVNSLDADPNQISLRTTHAIMNRSTM